MTTVRQVTDHSGLLESIRSWHEFVVARSFTIRIASPAYITAVPEN